MLSTILLTFSRKDSIQTWEVEVEVEVEAKAGCAEYLYWWIQYEGETGSGHQGGAEGRIELRVLVWP